MPTDGHAWSPIPVTLFLAPGIFFGILEELELPEVPLNLGFKRKRWMFPNFPAVLGKRRRALLCGRFSSSLRDTEPSFQGHTAKGWLGQELSLN